MVKPAKLLQRLLDGNHGISFRDFERVLIALGFVWERTKGSHRQYVHPKVEGAARLPGAARQEWRCQTLSDPRTA